MAGGAKLSNLEGFSTTVRLFVPRRLSQLVGLRDLALAIAVGESLLGLISLSLPDVAWPNALVLAAGCGFIAVSALGYAFYRGRSCNCFGTLSGRTFDANGVLRSGAIVIAASLAMLGVPRQMVELDVAGRLLLLNGGVWLALASFTAARFLVLSNTAHSRLQV